MLGTDTDTLFINDVSRVFMPITDDGENVEDATVSFEVWTTEDDSGEMIGTSHSMAWNAGKSKYIGEFPAAEGALLTKYDVAQDGPYYWVHITATNTTDRRIKCKALYRGAN